MREGSIGIRMLKSCILLESAASAATTGNFKSTKVLLRDALREKNGIMWEKRGGGSDPNPLLDVYLPNNFGHTKNHSEVQNIFYKKGGGDI